MQQTIIDDRFFTTVQSSIKRRTGKSVPKPELREFVHSNLEQVQEQGRNFVENHFISQYQGLVVNQKENIIISSNSTDQSITVPTSTSCSGELNLYQEVEQHFSDYTRQDKEAIVLYLENRAITNARDLRNNLEALASLEYTLFSKVVGDYHSLRANNSQRLHAQLAHKEQAAFSQIVAQDAELKKRHLEYLQEFGII